MRRWERAQEGTRDYPVNDSQLIPLIPQLVSQMGYLLKAESTSGIRADPTRTKAMRLAPKRRQSREAMMKTWMSPYSAGWLPTGWSSVPLEQCGLGGTLACSASPVGVLGLGTHTLTILQRRALSTPWAGCSILQACYKPRLDGVCGFPAMGWDQLWDGFCCGMFSAVEWFLWVLSCGASSPQLVVGRAPWSRQDSVVQAAPCCGSLRLPCPLALSHGLTLPCSPPCSILLHHPHGSLPGHLSQVWLLRTRPGFGTVVLAMHPCCPQPWQGAGTHPDTPVPQVPQHLREPVALSGLPSRKHAARAQGV